MAIRLARMAVTRPVLVVAGPTASGKSSAAVRIAEQFAGVVINADSMQLYRALRIVTARPDDAALARAPHRLYGVLEPEIPSSAASWRALALAEIEACGDRLPILVGGTGLYLRALIEGLADLPQVPREIRAAATARHAFLGSQAFHAEIATRDPDFAARTPPGDTQRLIRAWEMVEATGRRFSEWVAMPPVPPPDGLRFIPIVLSPPRDALYRAIDARVIAMLDDGALQEVVALSGLDPAAPILKAVGVRALQDHLAGDLTLAEATTQMQQATRQYAKRQTTWFRHQLIGATHFAQFYNPVEGEIFAFIRQNLLTTPI